MEVEATDASANALAESNDTLLLRTEIWMPHNTLEGVAKSQNELLRSLSATS